MQIVKDWDTIYTRRSCLQLGVIMFWGRFDQKARHRVDRKPTQVYAPGTNNPDLFTNGDQETRNGRRTCEHKFVDISYYRLRPRN